MSTPRRQDAKAQGKRLNVSALVTAGSVVRQDNAFGTMIAPVIEEVSPDPDSAVQGIAYSRQLALTQGSADTWQLIAGPPQEVILGNGAVQVVTLDSYRMISEDRFRTESAARLEDLLRAGRDRYRWQVVATHHPLRTNGAQDGAWWKGTLPKLFSFLLFPSHVLAAARIPPFDFLNEGVASVRYAYYRRAVEAAVQRSGAPVAVVLAGHAHDLQLLAPTVTGGPFTLVSGSAAKCTPVRARSDTLFASYAAVEDRRAVGSDHPRRRGTR